MDCPHTLLVEADAQINGLINLAVPASDQSIDFLTGYQLMQLLQPIADRIEKAMKLVE